MASCFVQLFCFMVMLDLEGLEMVSTQGWEETTMGQEMSTIAEWPTIAGTEMTTEIHPTGMMTTAENPTGLPVAVSMARTTPFIGYADPLSFPEVQVDIGDAWNRFTNTLSVTDDSTYFFHINAGASPYERINLQLEGVDYPMGLIRTSNSHNGVDTTGRSLISPVSSGATVKVKQLNGNQVFSNGGKITSFTAFDLGRCLSATDRTIFAAVRERDWNAPGEISFEDEILDTGSNFDLTRFYAPITGIYFFTVSIGVIGGQNARVKLMHGEQSVAELYKSSTTHNNDDTYSKTIMLSMGQGDYFSTKLASGKLFSDGYFRTSLSGFYYQPVSGAPAAWSVYRSSSISGPVNPLPFDGSSVNTNLFNFGDNTVHITTPGLYYVSLDIAVATGQGATVHLIRSDFGTEFSIVRDSTSHDGVDPLSQSILVELSAGDTLKVVVDAGSYIYSDADMQTFFTGFLANNYSL